MMRENRQTLVPRRSNTAVVEKIKQYIHEGNIRRVVVTREERTVAQLPLTVAVIGAVVAPGLAMVLALAALFTRSTIHMEVTETAEQPLTEMPA
jgi:hypothetical protein